MNSRRVLFGTVLVALAAVSLRADEKLESLSGTCSIRASNVSNKVELDMNRDTDRRDCDSGKHCHTSNMDEAIDAFTGITLADLQREGAHLDAVLTGEAGTLRCSGNVHDAELTGSFTFEPNKAFVTRMRELGITGLDSDKLEVYALFHIETSWVAALQKAGVTGIDANNLIALRIFNVTPEYVQSLTALGYSVPSAEKLVGLKVQGVNPAEIKQIQAMGYHPSIDELIQMRIFKVTPDFIERMKAKGFDNLTIAKLVQIRIFKIAE
jgi:hypothetical protein